MGLRPRARGHRDLLLALLRRLHRAGEGARVRRGAGGGVGRPGAADRARRAAAAVRAGAAVRDRGGVVVVARGLGARAVLAGGVVPPRRRRRPARARPRCARAGRGAQGQERRQDLTAHPGDPARHHGVRRRLPLR